MNGTELAADLAIGAGRAAPAAHALELPTACPWRAFHTGRRASAPGAARGRKPSQATRAAAAGMSLRSFQRARAAARRAGWDARSCAKP